MAFATVVVPIAPGTDGAVREAVRKFGGPAGKAHAALLDCLHFMSITVIAEPQRPPLLLLELSTDCPVETALRRLAESLGAQLDPIFEAAQAVRYTKHDRASFLLTHSVGIGTNWTSALRRDRMVGMPFTGLPGMTVGRVRQEDELNRRIMATGLLHGTETALAKLRRIRSAIWADGDKKWAFEPLYTPFLQPPTPGTLRINATIMVAALLPLLWPLLLVPLAAWLYGWQQGSASPLGLALLVTTAVWLLLAVLGYRKLTAAEASDVPDDRAPDPAKVADVMVRENAGPLNLLVTVSRIKPGPFRRFTLRSVFRITQHRIAGRGRPGFLGENGEIGTLHSGRWIVLPGTDLLVFTAHYDGSWLSYMQDFIDLIPFAPTGIWSNTEGFPRTRLLFGEGATDGDRVTRWFHGQQRPIDFWYAASPGLTLGRIRANAAIRQGFASAETEPEAEAWLALFGAPSPRTRDALPRGVGGEIPTLAFGALTHERHAACLVLAFKDDAAAPQQWLAELAPRIAYGHAQRGGLEPVHVLALTASGLRRLGLADKALDTFPAAFVNGMHSPARARVLGDDPKEWAWGKASAPADAVVLVYAGTQALLDRSILKLEASCAVCVRTRIDCQVRHKGNASEPFGFRDGLSQPVIPGTPASDRQPSPDQIVGPGEFVLGYQDDRGHYPPVPTVAAASDVGQWLPALPGSPPGQVDLGRNSSFLVIRQLRQDVASFDRFAADRAQATGKTAAYIKAKMMGRWQNGSSLVRNPHRPGPAPDNDFRFGADDPDGLACPRGAHIRRANPRDSLHADRDGAVKIVKRRRILRVGRPYVDRPGGRPQGMLFMCLNADIERQFELVQQAWLHNASFDGLHDETDPVLGRSTGTRSFTVPTAHGPVCLTGLPNFVTVVGGGYFWLPSASAIEFLTRLPPPVATPAPATTTAGTCPGARTSGTSHCIEQEVGAIEPMEKAGSS